MKNGSEQKKIQFLLKKLKTSLINFWKKCIILIHKENFYYSELKEKEEMRKKTFTPISSQTGSIGAEMERSEVVKALMEYAGKRGRKPDPRTIVESTMNKANLSKKVLGKYESYLDKLSTMSYRAAIKYTANFYKKGLATYVPAGSFKK